MNNRTCTACNDYPADGDTYLCQRCADDFHAHVAELPDLARELEVELTRQTQKGDRQQGRSNESNLPFSFAASDLLHELRFWLVTTIEALTPRDVRLDGSWEALCATLALREHWLALFPTAGDAVRSLADFRRRALRLIDSDPERVWIGDCDCGSPRRPIRGQRLWTCPNCDATWDVQEVIEYRDEVARDQLLTTDEIKLLCGVPKSTIRSWAKRRRIASGGINRDGANLYRYGDVLDLAG